MDIEQLQDGAAPGPEDSGAVLGVLRSVGLTGPRLALQVGEEEQLGRQVAERSGVAYGDCIRELMANLIKDACTSLELDARLEGSATTPGAQAIGDAVAHLVKKQDEEPGVHEEGPTVQIVLPRKGRMTRARQSVLGSLLILRMKKSGS